MEKYIGDKDREVFVCSVEKAEKLCVDNCDTCKANLDLAKKNKCKNVFLSWHKWFRGDVDVIGVLANS